MERRQFISKLDPSHRLKPIEAARENARLKGHELNESEWKKLKPEAKAEKLKQDGYKEILDYHKPVNRAAVEAELEHLKKLPVGPLEPKEAQKQVDRIRKAVQAVPDDNVAIAQVVVDGEVDSMAALNGLTSPEGTIPRLDPSQKKFKIIEEFGGAIDHADDSEVKLLEFLAARLSKTQFEKGTVYIYTERPACKSCKFVKAQFENMFNHRIKVEFTNKPKLEK